MRPQLILHFIISALVGVATAVSLPNLRDLAHQRIESRETTQVVTSHLAPRSTETSLPCTDLPQGQCPEDYTTWQRAGSPTAVKLPDERVSEAVGKREKTEDASLEAANAYWKDRHEKQQRAKKRIWIVLGCVLGVIGLVGICILLFFWCYKPKPNASSKQIPV
ncbi:hypothetical protein B0T20DRAFT_502163 [Sordaria brevicollis]|uniref:Transmembrane protein n=1 Tax=Sordaria brevicollis TaxID=83679 RepID=A0AAE0PBA0_SORBR|nr:hypothetical protein B0T20DRAFT_502163 [Sordaria brevicollis]